MSDKSNLRDYGLTNSEVVGTPTWQRTDPALPCPNCGGLLCEVKVAVTHSLLPTKAVLHYRGNVGTSTYLGCPACPYASPALVVAAVAGTVPAAKGKVDR
jgi:hypothetical protein